MSLLDTLKKNLTPEILATVQEALGDDFDYDMVPRTRLNKVIQQRNEARTQLSEMLDKGDGAGNDPDKKFTQADIDNAVNAQKEANATEIANLRTRFAVSGKLRDANFVDPNLILTAGLIDMSKVVTDPTGEITGGLEDQMAALKEARPYLLGNGAQRGTGKSGGTDDFGKVTSKEEFLKLSLEKQIEFKKANPDAFKSFMNA